jgi:hypothetical protein
MPHDIKRLTDYLIAVGIEDIAHTNKTYLAHLIGVYRDLEAWGCPEDVCRAGMFHSIYGTELFQGFKLPLDRRPEVRQQIGERAERLAFINCVMDRSSLDAALDQPGELYPIINRLGGELIEMTAADFDDLCRVHLCDWLEQVPRSQKWDCRRRAYARMAQRLGPAPMDAWQRVYATEKGAATF